MYQESIIQSSKDPFIPLFLYFLYIHTHAHTHKYTCVCTYPFIQIASQPCIHSSKHPSTCPLSIHLVTPQDISSNTYPSILSFVCPFMQKYIHLHIYLVSWPFFHLSNHLLFAHPFIQPNIHPYIQTGINLNIQSDTHSFIRLNI